MQQTRVLLVSRSDEPINQAAVVPLDQTQLANLVTDNTGSRLQQATCLYAYNSKVCILHTMVFT